MLYYYYYDCVRRESETFNRKIEGNVKFYSYNKNVNGNVFLYSGFGGNMVFSNKISGKRLCVCVELYVHEYNS